MGNIHVKLSKFGQVVKEEMFFKEKFTDDGRLTMAAQGTNTDHNSSPQVSKNGCKVNTQCLSLCVCVLPNPCPGHIMCCVWNCYETSQETTMGESSKFPKS